MSNYPYEKDVVLGKLPDLFTFEDGSKVTNSQDWQKRRKEILDTAIDLEYGGMPPKPEVFEYETMHQMAKGSLISYRIKTGSFDRTMTFTMQLYRPDREELCPVVLTGDGCYRKC